jgi:hypothetical protein
MTDAGYPELITAHYAENWGDRGTEAELPAAGRRDELPADFAVLEFAPGPDRRMWTYATRCMSQPGDRRPLELHLFSPYQSPEPVELLTAVAHYHRTGAELDLGHSVNFGKPWLDDSTCEYGLLSLPYLDGPKLENLALDDGTVVKFLWLIPITRAEVECKKELGLEALEEKFEAAGFNYLDPGRPSVC